jgi:hypothetical protein
MLQKIFLTALMVCSTLQMAQGTTSLGDKLDIHVGDLWKYRVLDGFTAEPKFDISYRVINLSDTEITTRMEWKGSPNKGLAVFDRHWNMIDDGRFKYEPSRSWLKFPLTLGLAWKQQFQSTHFQTGAAYSHFNSAVVAASETITVPAGTFVTMRLDIEGELRSLGNDGTVTKNVLKIWYSPEVNRIVREESQTFANGRLRDKSITELTEYLPAKITN